MNLDNDTEAGGEELSIEQAAAAFVSATSKEADTGQANEDMDLDEGEQAEDDLEASEQDGEDEDGDPDQEDQPEDEDGEEPDSDGGRFVASNGKVRLPDGTVSTVADLISGNLKERDYRQKTMALGEQRHALEEQSSSLKASLQEVDQQREYMTKLLEAIMPQDPDPMLSQTDPVGYMQAKAIAEQQRKSLTEHLDYIKGQVTEKRSKSEQESTAERQKTAQREWEKLLGVLPGLNDQAKVSAFTSDIIASGKEYGYTREELAEALPFDHRMTLVLRDAGKWRKLQASKASVKDKGKGRPPVQRSAKRQSGDARQAQRATDAVNRLKSSGTVDDAVAAYLASRKG